MIDTARVEQMLAEAQSWKEVSTIGTPRMLYIDVLTDYLALRAIVEALAASDPAVHGADPFSIYPFCRHCGSTLDPDDLEHADDCLYARAVALVGPAGDANPLDFEGIDTEGE